ncbi:MAG TPA: PAS domain S-box protein [Terriglobia bacterium]|nr:PAS domain S-box protein [Terriglobia bacterium]
MQDANPGGEEQKASHRDQARWLPKSYVFTLALGTALIGGFTSYVIHRDYRTALTLWRSRLSCAVHARTWMLRNSLQQSQDDAQVLADFAPTRELLLSEKNGSGASVPGATALKQVRGLFDDYNRVYQYAAVCLLDAEGRVVVQAMDSTAWTTVVGSAQFKELVRAVVRSRHYTVDMLQVSSEERALIFMMPVLPGIAANKSGPGPTSPVGVVAILDPLARELIPLLRSEHVSPNAETLLFWLQDGEGRYVSPRQYPSSGSAHRVSSPDTLQRAVPLAVEDDAVFGQFVDYRGVAVMAAMQRIPSLASVVVCKVDRKEALADFHRTVRLQVMAAAATLVVYVGLILWRRRNALAREMKERLAHQQAILTERLRTEALLRTVNDTLETKVAERTAQLAKANDRLRLELDEREKAEQALRASEERYRDLIENAGDIIYTHDLQGNFTSLNKAGERCLGYARDEILGTNVVQIVAAEYRDLALQMTRPQRRDPEANTYELETISKEGRRLILEVRPRVICDNGTAIGVQGIARDLTERKRLEQQFLQAQKMEAVGRLAGGIAHDFNNLLTIILGYCEVVLDQLPLESRFNNQLTEIKKAGKRAASLTAQLLAFSRRQVVTPQMLDVDTVVSDMDSMLRRLIGEDINLTTKLGVGPGRIRADRGQVEQVILNLAVNARDAMPLGGSLIIETASADVSETNAPPEVPVRPGRYVMLLVSDTGHGMDAQTQSHIFEPFFTTKEKDKGTGLGLATVYGIVKQAGGYVWAESAPQRGTTFKILLPQEDGVTSREPKPDPAPSELPTGAETILLVEDEETVRLLLREVLERSGYRVLEARRGDEGLQIGERTREPIQLLVTDVIMPQMGGAELARRLASSHPETRVLFMSGYTDGALSHDEVFPEDAAFIQKPFTPDVLARKVREVLERKALASPRLTTP